MSYKEWQAVIQIAGVVLVLGLLLAGVFGPLADTPLEVARRLLWAVGAAIGFNVLATVVVSVVLTAARGEQFEDAPADERDTAIDTRSSRIAYAVTSAAAALCLVPIAMGADPLIAVLALFFAPLLGGVSHAAALLVYYRVS